MSGPYVEFDEKSPLVKQIEELEERVVKAEAEASYLRHQLGGVGAYQIPPGVAMRIGGMEIRNTSDAVVFIDCIRYHSNIGGMPTTEDKHLEEELLLRAAEAAKAVYDPLYERCKLEGLAPDAETLGQDKVPPLQRVIMPPTDPQMWFMSSVGDPSNFSYNPEPDVILGE